MKYLLLPALMLFGCNNPEVSTTNEIRGHCVQWRNINIERVGGCDSTGLCGIYVDAYSYDAPSAQTQLTGLGTAYKPTAGNMVLDAYVCRYGVRNSPEFLFSYDLRSDLPTGYVLDNPDDHKLNKPCCEAKK